MSQPKQAFSNDFERWWNAVGESVEAGNTRDSGFSGVIRAQDPSLGTLYIKRQQNYLYRDFRDPLGRPTILREKAAIAAMNKIGITVPPVVFAEAQKDKGGWKAVLVTQDLSGYCSLDRWYQQGGRDRLGNEQHAKLLQALGKTLKVIHSHRWQHAAMYPKHLFVTAGDANTLPSIALIDLEKARQKITPWQAARRDLDQLKRRSKHWSEADWAGFMAGYQPVKL